MGEVIDFHVYAFPDRLTGLDRWVTDPVRAGLRASLRPFANSLHHAQTYLRYLPGTPRRTLEQLGLLAPIPALLVESRYSDLKAAMDEAQIQRAVVVAHPPFIENDFVLELAERDPRLIPAVYISPGTRRPAEVLRKLVQRGARALKLHPSADGERPDAPRYRALLGTAQMLGLPVIVHTGRFQIPFILKAPEYGDAECFTPWFETYPDVTFVLAHMNYSQPLVALDLAEQHPNVLLECSWQPAELIGEAVARLGAERILFGTDWPLLGNNMMVGRRRVADCVDSGVLTEIEAELVLGGNAQRVLFGKRAPHAG